MRAERLEIHKKFAKRTSPYIHKAGAFVLTASFKQMDRDRINLAGSLAKSFTQKQIADVLGVSTSTAGKMIRVYYYENKSC